MKTIIFTTIGSLGDLHPIMGIAQELKNLGHRPIIATSEYYREYLLNAQLEFHPVRPSLNLEDSELVKAVLDTKDGPELLHKKYIFPELQNSIDDLLKIASGADLIVGSVLTYYVPIVSHITKVPWLNAIVAPISMWSGYDPPILAPLPFLGKMRFLNHNIHHWILKSLFKVSEPWARPLKELRVKYGMTAGKNPFWEGLYEGKKTLCLWSDTFYSPKPDWPENALATGFIFYDPKQDHELPLDILDFRKKHKNVCVFTLGSTAVQNPQEFLEIFIETSKRLDAGCIITTGRKHIDEYRSKSTDKLLFIDYAPYSLLFPLADIIIHQGGVGTTAQCLKSGKPQIVLPFCMDQFDNGYRIKRLCAGEVIEKKHLTITKLSNVITSCLTDLRIKDTARQISTIMANENGARKAAEEIIKSI